jgi:hypothetical protein
VLQTKTLQNHLHVPILIKGLISNNIKTISSAQGGRNGLGDLNVIDKQNKRPSLIDTIIPWQL